MKYNDNGTYKDIYVKTFDTLPVGTEVDYDGSTVPDGWTEVESPEWINISTTKFSASYRMLGKFVEIWVENKANQTLPGYSSTVISTLPEKARPTKWLRINPFQYQRNNIYFQIRPNGTVEFFNWGNEWNMGSDTGVLAAHIIYIAE